MQCFFSEIFQILSMEKTGSLSRALRPIHASIILQKVAELVIPEMMVVIALVTPSKIPLPHHLCNTPWENSRKVKERRVK